MPNYKKTSEILVSKTKIYLIIIAILFIVLCYLNVRLILPAIIIYLSILAYSLWTTNRNKLEISKHIQDLTISVDSAAKSTLINSPIPLVIIETNGNILWRSSKFNNEFINIDIGSYLRDLLKELKSEIEKNQGKEKKSIEKEILIGKKTYKVLGEYVKSKNSDRRKTQEYMAILYFLDETEKVSMLKKYDDIQTCIGLIMIDNYEEIMQRISAESKPQVLAEIEKSIYDWAGLTNGLIVKTDRNSFVYVFERKNLEELEESKFNILDTIKEIDIEGRLQLTISIALTDEGETIYEKYKSAMTTMDIALGRGGDQAVVRKDGKYIFFGGRTQEVEKRTKVKARIVAGAMAELIQEASKVMVMGHSNGDIDSMGSSLGIYRFVKTLGKECYIVNNTYGLTLENLMYTIKKDEEYKNVILDKSEAISEIDENTLLVIVDTNKANYVEVPELLEKTNKIVIIDHHRMSTDFIEPTILTFHEVYASSTAELVTELLEYADEKMELTDLEAESLYAGIMMDTKNFTFKTGVRTFEAAAYLRRHGVDIIKVKKWFQSDLENYNIISNIVRNAEITNDTIGISVYDKQSKDANIICAKAADELLTISDITASFVIGDMGDKVCISGRSIGDINVQLILEKLRRRRSYNSCWSTSRRNDNRRSKTRINNQNKRIF
ncbi:MAG: DHH family phosphoesterase [Clostridia bacterium]|nr:DHH family phosphoesterase [Clostridia bacterium]